MRRIAVTAVLTVLCWILTAALPTPAGAHAELVTTTPTADQRLETPPSEVVLEFTERVHLVSGAIRLLDSTGRPVSTGAARVDGVRVILPLPKDLPRGGYLVSWRVISSDTHPVAGGFGFGVGADPPRAKPPGKAELADPQVRAAVSVNRWVGYAGLALFLGGTVFLLACWPAGRSQRRARRLVGAGWITTVAATVLGLLLQGPYVAGPGSPVFAPHLLAETVTSPFGAIYLIRLALLVTVGLLVRAVLRTQAPTRLALSTAGLLGIGVAVSYAAAGHAVSGQWPAVALASDALHVTSMSVWGGGLVLLAACALRSQHADGVSDAAHRFSRLAISSVAVLTATGTLQAVREIDSLAALTRTGYGQLLLGKLMIVVGLLGLGAVSMRAVRRSLDTDGRLRRTVPLEIGLIAVVLGITAVLVVTPPARQTSGSPPQPAQMVLQVPGGGTTQLRVAPAAVGPNQVSIRVLDSAGRLRHVPEVTVTATLPGQQLGPFDVHLAAEGHAFTGHVNLPVPGAWRFDLTVRTTDLDAYVLSTPIRVR